MKEPIYVVDIAIAEPRAEEPDKPLSYKATEGQCGSALGLRALPRIGPAHGIAAGDVIRVSIYADPLDSRVENVSQQV